MWVVKNGFGVEIKWYSEEEVKNILREKKDENINTRNDNNYRYCSKDGMWNIKFRTQT